MIRPAKKKLFGGTRSRAHDLSGYLTRVLMGGTFSGLVVAPEFSDRAVIEVFLRFFKLLKGIL